MTRFTAADVERAHAEWRCSCGPAALAAICDLALDEVRRHFGARFPGYTNPTLMFTALNSVDATWSARLDATRKDPHGMMWPRWGLCRIQWEGPWTDPGANPRWAYRHTHWVGAETRGPADVGVFDVNAVANGSGWVSLAAWSRVVVPALTADVPHAAGGWRITHAIEVER